jgi:hypothetical protein
MRAILPVTVIVVAMLAVGSPDVRDGTCTDAHELPRFVLERVELQYGAAGDCVHHGRRGPACPAPGAAGAELRSHDGAAACPTR